MLVCPYLALASVDFYYVMGCVNEDIFLNTRTCLVRSEQVSFQESDLPKSELGVGSLYALASSLLKRSCKRLAMGVGDSTCCAVFLKRPTSFSGILLWLKGVVFMEVLENLLNSEHYFLIYPQAMFSTSQDQGEGSNLCPFYAFHTFFLLYTLQGLYAI